MTEVDITTLHAKNPMDLWKKVYERIFPQEVSVQLCRRRLQERSGKQLLFNELLVCLF